MGRRKLSSQVDTDLLGIKVPLTVTEQLTAIADATGQKKSTVGRNFLLLGKAIYDSCLAMGIQIKFSDISTTHIQSSASEKAITDNRRQPETGILNFDDVYMSNPKKAGKRSSAVKKDIDDSLAEARKVLELERRQNEGKNRV